MRRDVDDMSALPLRLDLGHERHETVDDAAEIDAHDPVVVGIARFVGRAEHADAGVVDQHLDVAERRSTSSATSAQRARSVTSSSHEARQIG